MLFKFYNSYTTCQYVCSEIFDIFVSSRCLRFDFIPSKKRSESISDSSELQTGILYLGLRWWSELLVHYLWLFPSGRAAQKLRKVKVEKKVLSLNFARQLLAGWPVTFQQSKALSNSNTIDNDIHPDWTIQQLHGTLPANLKYCYNM